jgi:ectoine hydroxylase-related dioxygenase (phytanoyl-CoA dioxygenase family)
MKVVAGNLHTQGFMIVELAEAAERIASIRLKFERQYRERFADDPARNRNLIKLFAEDLDVKRFFCAPEISRLLADMLELAEPVQTGPIVTHYTSGDLTGNNYGLPYHQDWPSMGTSTKGLIVWTSVTDVDRDGPGLRIVPGSHLAGLWPGDQTDAGYVLRQQEIDGCLDIEIQAGHILLMSPYLVHKTRTAQAAGWKLSLSCRFDDLSCAQWNRRGFVSAYKTAVDRSAYLK